MAFHPYPQLIRPFCSRGRCGPPRDFTHASTWPWIAHSVSGLVHDTNGLFTLAFTSASGITPLTKRHTANSLARSTKSTQSPRRAPTHYKHTVSGTISSPSRGAFHLSLTVLVHYRSPNLFSLGRWSSQIQAGLHVSDPTQEHSRILPYFHRRDYYPLWCNFPDALVNRNSFRVEVLQPHIS